MKRLISFDIDGTLEAGDPPGPITMDMVRSAVELGHVIGSCSDRTLADQRGIWAHHGITVSFVRLKHELGDVKSLFPADEYLHIGDTNMDKHYAELAGFEFLPVQSTADERWM